MSSGVSVHVYDLSQGLAAALSPSLIGKQIGGVWHTGVVVYGREYFFGGGIQVRSVSVVRPKNKKETAPREAWLRPVAVSSRPRRRVSEQ